MNALIRTSRAAYWRSVFFLAHLLTWTCAGLTGATIYNWYWFPATFNPAYFTAYFLGTAALFVGLIQGCRGEKQ